MNSGRLKITIAIPTRERAKYLRYSLQTALQVEDDDLEIVVSDNASSDETAKVVGEFNDRRLKYVNTGRRVSMRQNFEFALSTSTGDYVMFIGDDDGVIPQQFRALRQILTDERPDGLSWPLINYGWRSPDNNARGGFRLINNNLFGTITKFDNVGNTRKLLAGPSGELPPLPRIYHGCASRAFLDRARTPDGEYFGGAIPDVYFSFQATMEGGTFLYVQHPFSVNGSSAATTGGAHKGRVGSDTGDSAGRAFTSEIAQDHKQDVVDHAFSLPLVLFSTLETVRRQKGIDVPNPDYLAWYRYILSSTSRENTALRNQVYKVLSHYSEKTNSQKEWAVAKMTASRLRWRLNRLVMRLNGIGPKLKSVRLDATVGGENTILSAVNLIDAVLDDDFHQILQGVQTKDSAWKNVVRRARPFPRQL